MNYSTTSQASIYFSAPNYSSQPISENNNKPHECNIEEAETSLQGSDSLNCEEARAVLGRYEYQAGNIEAALRVFDGIDISAVTPKIKISLNGVGKPPNSSNNYAAPPFSLNTVGLLLEAAYLKSKSLQNIGRYKEAAESCKVILDIIESSLPDGLPEDLDTDHKLQETVSNVVELLPYLWQLANLHHEAILSYRKAILHHWKYLNNQTIAKIQKEFAIFLLYCGGEEAYPPNLVFQIDSLFIPKNSIEEAILLLMILLTKVSLKEIKFDPSVLDHLSYALSISDGLAFLGQELEALLPGIIDDNEKYLLLALCYYGQGENLSALNLLKNLYENENPNCGLALLMASKIYGENSNSTEAVITAKRAIQVLKHKCHEIIGVGHYFLGVSLSAYSRLAVTDLERVNRQHEALECLETAGRLTRTVDSRILYDLSLENAEERKLDAALVYVNRLLNLEGGSNLKGWMLLARILSAQNRFRDSESIINAALDQTEKWDQGELLRTKAKLQLAQGEVKHAIQTYTHILAVLQVKYTRFGITNKYLEEVGDRRLELYIWNDLATVYISLSQWHDAEACLVKSKAIRNYSASTRHTIGLLYEAKGLYKEALKAYKHALDVDPIHVQSLVSMAVVFRKLGGQSGPTARSFLNEALRVDMMHSSAWYNLGLLLKDEGPMCLREAVDCFEAAGVLKETEPIEPFR